MKGVPNRPLSKSSKREEKGAIRGSRSPTNPDTDNLKPISSDNTLRVASTTGKQTNAEVSDSFLEGYQNQNQPARDHPSGRNTLLGVTASSTSTATPASPTRKVSALGYPNKTRNGVTRRNPTRTASLVGSWTENSMRKSKQPSSASKTQTCKWSFARPEGATARWSSFLSRIDEWSIEDRTHARAMSRDHGPFGAMRLQRCFAYRQVADQKLDHDACLTEPSGESPVHPVMPLIRVCKWRIH